MTSTALWLALGSMAFVLVVLWAIHKLGANSKKPQDSASDHFATPVMTDTGAHSCGSDGGGASCDGGGH
jgi:hypothetical protein